MQTKAATGPVLAVVGGVAMAVGAVLPFAKVEGGVSKIASQTVNGLDTSDGKVYLGFGIAIVVLALLAWVMKGAGRKVFAVLALLAAGFMLYAAIVDVSGAESAALKGIAEEIEAVFPAGTTIEVIVDSLKQAGVGVSTGVGLYVVLVGSALGVLASLLALFQRAAAPPAEMAPAPPAPPAAGGPAPGGPQQQG